MNRTQIGKQIALQRRKAGLTQAQLAEMLSVSDKAVSKWENGICLPKSSLYEPLCAALGLTMETLFAHGERFSQKAEKSLLEMLEYRMYQMSDQKIGFEEFSQALHRISEVSLKLKSFPSQAEAVAFLIRESGATPAECEKAYHFYLGLFEKGKETGK